MFNKGGREMNVSLKLSSASTLIALGVGIASVAHAQTAATDQPAATDKPAATNNECWGDIANQVGQLGVMGVHSAASSPFNPTPEDPRLGVANQGLLLEQQGKITEGDPGQGGMGNHAIFVGGLAGGPISSNDLLCDGTPGNPGPAAVP
jgi:hypothetical protein